MDPVYTQEGFTILFAEAGASYGSSEGRIEEQAAWIKQQGLLQTSQRLIDLGCHHGEFLSVFPTELERIGIDLSVASIDRAKSLPGNENIRFIAGGLTNVLPDLDAALITMMHVLEHLPDPCGTLKRLRELADPATRLVVEVPLLEQGRTNDINGFLSVTHLTHFSRASLRRCIEYAGWVMLDWDEQPRYNGCRVILKPCTTANAPAPTGDPRDLTEANAYLAHWYSAVNQVITRLETAANTPQLIIWGAGLHTEFLYHLTPVFSGDSERQFLLVDSDLNKQGKHWRGIPILKPETLARPELRDIPIVISTYRGQEAVAHSAEQIRGHTGQLLRPYKTVHSY